MGNERTDPQKSRPTQNPTIPDRVGSPSRSARTFPLFYLGDCQDKICPVVGSCRTIRRSLYVSENGFGLRVAQATVPPPPVLGAGFAPTGAGLMPRPHLSAPPPPGVA